MAPEPPHVNCRVTREVEKPSSAGLILPNGVVFTDSPGRIVGYSSRARIA